MVSLSADNSAAIIVNFETRSSSSEHCVFHCMFPFQRKLVVHFGQKIKASGSSTEHLRLSFCLFTLGSLCNRGRKKTQIIEAKKDKGKELEIMIETNLMGGRIIKTDGVDVLMFFISTFVMCLYMKRVH